MKHWFLLLMIGTALPAAGAFEYSTQSAFSNSLQNSYIAYALHPVALAVNPALLGYTHSTALSLNYSQPYNLPGLQYGNLAFAHDFGRFASGVIVDHLGHSLYAETKISPGFCWHHRESGLSLGVAVPIYLVSADGYPSASATGVNLGFVWQAGSRINLGGSVDNINRPRLAGSEEEIPQYLRFGVSWFIDQDLTVHATMCKDAWFDPEVVIAVDYSPAPVLGFRSSFNTETEIPAAGLYTGIGSWRVEYAYQHHLELGASHTLGLTWQR